MRTSIEAALESTIVNESGGLRPVDYLRSLANQLTIIQLALLKAEEAEGRKLPLKKTSMPSIDACKNALYKICKS